MVTVKELITRLLERDMNSPLILATRQEDGELVEVALFAVEEAGVEKVINSTQCDEGSDDGAYPDGFNPREN